MCIHGARRWLLLRLLLVLTVLITSWHTAAASAELLLFVFCLLFAALFGQIWIHHSARIECSVQPYWIGFRFIYYNRSFCETVASCCSTGSQKPHCCCTFANKVENTEHEQVSCHKVLLPLGRFSPPSPPNMWFFVPRLDWFSHFCMALTWPIDTHTHWPHYVFSSTPRFIIIITIIIDIFRVAYTVKTNARTTVLEGR